MRPQKGRGIVISGGIVEVAELRRGTNPQGMARALLCCLSVNSASLGPDRLCCCLLNSLDGVRGGLVSGIQPAMGGLEGISRVGRTFGTPDAHPNLKEEPCRDSRPQLSGGAQLRSCSDTPVRYFKNTSSGRRASPPVNVRALACLPNSLPHHEPRRGGRIWKKNRVRAAFSYPPTNRRNPFQKHGKSGVTTPTTNLLKMVFWSCAYVPLAGVRM